MNKPVITYNSSNSAPIGFYRVYQALPRKGDTVLVKLAPKWRRFMEQHGIVPAHVPLLKQVAATHGDRVCRKGLSVTINGELRAVAIVRDAQGRSLPSWQGCRVLGEGEVFLLSGKRSSFDGRYFGVVGRSKILGVAYPVLVQAG